MNSVIVLPSQRMIDIAMQELGDVEKLFDIALLNGKSVTEDTAAGISLLVDDYDKSKRSIVQVLRRKGFEPASANDLQFPPLPPGGIGFMQIGTTFKVS